MPKKRISHEPYEYGGREPELSPDEIEYAQILSEKKAMEETHKPWNRAKRAGFHGRRSFMRDVMGIKSAIHKGKEEEEKVKKSKWLKYAKQMRKEAHSYFKNK